METINICHASTNREIKYLFNNQPILTVGAHTYIGPGVIINYLKKPQVITIGKFCSVAENIKIILGGNHHYDFVTNFPIYELILKNQVLSDANRIKSQVLNKNFSLENKTEIGNDVWIGIGVTILQGVTIGDGAVIGAMSVVASDVPPYAIVVGNPCRIIKYRFTKLQVEKLLSIKWWLFNEEKIIEIADKLQSDNIDLFIEEFYKF